MPNVIIEASGPRVPDTFAGPVEMNWPDIGLALDALRASGYNELTIHRVDIVCDFCSTPKVVCMYQIEPGGDMGKQVVLDDQLEILDSVSHIDKDGQWGACATCRDFIKTMNWKGLMDHSAVRMNKLHGVPMPLALAMVDGPIGCFSRGYHGQEPKQIGQDEEIWPA